MEREALSVGIVGVEFYSIEPFLICFHFLPRFFARFLAGKIGSPGVAIVVCDPPLTHLTPKNYSSNFRHQKAETCLFPWNRVKEQLSFDSESMMSEIAKTWILSVPGHGTQTSLGEARVVSALCLLPALLFLGQTTTRLIQTLVLLQISRFPGFARSPFGTGNGALKINLRHQMRKQP